MKVISIGLIEFALACAVCVIARAGGADSYPPMPDMAVAADESRVVDYDVYTFGYLQGTPRIEGRRTTLTYRVIPGYPPPGALGICRHFVAAVREAGGEVLYDNHRNIAVGRLTQADVESWAEIACDDDRYTLNIVERKAAPQTDAAQPAVASEHVYQHNQTDLELRGRPVSPSSTAIAQQVQKTWRTKNFRIAIGDVAADSTNALAGSAAETAGGAKMPPTVAECADAPTELTRALPGQKKWKNIELRRGFQSELIAQGLHPVNSHLWSCHTPDGALVQGALIPAADPSELSAPR